MSAPPSTSAKGKLKLVRPASIELRFSNKKQYVRHIRLYRKALGITKPFNPPKPPLGYTHADSTYSFPVGLVPVGGATKDLELRFVLLSKKQIGKNRTVIYWEVKKDDIATVSDSLVKRLGYTVIHPLHSTTTPPNADSARTSLSLIDSPGDTSSGGAMPAASLIAASSRADDGNEMGLVINPPWPRYADGGGAESFVPQLFTPFVWLALAIGLLIGWGLTSLLRRTRRQ